MARQEDDIIATFCDIFLSLTEHRTWSSMPQKEEHCSVQFRPRNFLVLRRYGNIVVGRVGWLVG